MSLQQEYEIVIKKNADSPQETIKKTRASIDLRWEMQKIQGIINAGKGFLDIVPSNFGNIINDTMREKQINNVMRLGGQARYIATAFATQGWVGGVTQVINTGLQYAREGIAYSYEMKSANIDSSYLAQRVGRITQRGNR